MSQQHGTARSPKRTARGGTDDTSSGQAGGLQAGRRRRDYHLSGQHLSKLRRGSEGSVDLFIEKLRWPNDAARQAYLRGLAELAAYEAGS